MDYLLCMDAFVRVAEVGSFSEVARQLSVSKSVVTNRVQQLEALVGAPVFHRSTRMVRLSEIGLAYFDECAQLVANANQVVDQMQQFRKSPSGLLRIHAIPGVVLGRLTNSLLSFQEQYPLINFDFVLNDLVVDPIREGYDCVLQLFAAISEDLVQKKLFRVHRVFCASPEYLAKHEPILHPQDLFEHRLGLYSRYPTKDKWSFSHGDEVVELDIKPQIRSNAVHFLKEIAMTSGAVVCLPTMVAAEELMAGRLVTVLRDYHLPLYWLSAVFPRTQRNSIKLRLFLDYVTKDFTELPAWDRALLEAGHLLPHPSKVE